MERVAGNKAKVKWKYLGVGERMLSLKIIKYNVFRNLHLLPLVPYLKLLAEHKPYLKALYHVCAPRPDELGCRSGGYHIEVLSILYFDAALAKRCYNLSFVRDQEWLHRVFVTIVLDFLCGYESSHVAEIHKRGVVTQLVCIDHFHVRSVDFNQVGDFYNMGLIKLNLICSFYGKKHIKRI